MKVGSAISWLILSSLVTAVVLMATWWNVASIPSTGSTTFILMFATMGLWVSLFMTALTLWRLFMRRGNVGKKSDRA